MDQPFVDKLLHLGLFVAAAAFIAVCAVAVLERLLESSAPVIRRGHLAAAAAPVVAFALAERLYHYVT